MPGTNILYLIGSLQYGGAQSQLFELVSHLDRSRFTPTIGTLSETVGLAPDFSSIGVTIESFARRGKYDPLPVLRLARFLRAHRIDIIHTWLPSAGIVGRLAVAMSGRRVRIVHAERGFSDPGRAARGLLRRVLGGVARKRMAAVITNSHHLSDTLADQGRYPGVPIEVIPNGFTPHRFDRANADSRARIRTELGVGERDLLVGTVANLVPAKNHEMFLKVVARVSGTRSDVHFLVVGDDVTNSGALQDYRASMTQRFTEASERFHFHWLSYRNDVGEILDALDVFLLTSTSESFPNALFEAMAAEVPIISTAVGDVPRWVTDDYGRLVPAGDERAMSAALLEVLDDLASARMTAKRARALVEDQLSVRNMVETTQSLYARVMSV
jgi:glycosyltransferase involved in cell wall biosynthesis